MPYVGEYYNSGWQTLTPLNGWAQRAGEAPFSYCVTGMTVQIRGSLNPPGVLTGNLTIGVIPNAAPDGFIIRPPYLYKFIAAGLTLGGVALGCNITVDTSGNISLDGVTALAQLSLSSVRFTLSV